MDKKEAQKKATSFAEDLQGIVGQLPMERVVAQYIEFFNDLRSMGVTWPQVAKLMESVGVRRKDSTSVPAEQWRAMVSRSRSITSLKELTPNIINNQQPGPITYPARSLPNIDTERKPEKKAGINTAANIRHRMRQASNVRRKGKKP